MALWQQIVNVVHPQLQEGPAVTYNTSLPTAGKYVPEGAIHSMFSSVAPGLVHPGGSIEVNPNNTADVEKTIHHEKVHALLNNLNANGTLDKLNASNPYYKQIAPKIMLEPGGDASQEAPAYTATGESAQMGIDPKVAKQYTQYLQQQLHQVDPFVAKAYGELSQ
jgi:hypothetical protein